MKVQFINVVFLVNKGVGMFFELQILFGFYFFYQVKKVVVIVKENVQIYFNVIIVVVYLIVYFIVDEIMGFVQFNFVFCIY